MKVVSNSPDSVDVLDGVADLFTKSLLVALKLQVNHFNDTSVYLSQHSTSP